MSDSAQFASAGCTIKVKVWVARDRVPLVAVRRMLKGAPVVSGGVPLSTPVVAFRLAQEGRPLALKVGVG